MCVVKANVHGLCEAQSADLSYTATMIDLALVKTLKTAIFCVYVIR